MSWGPRLADVIEDAVVGTDAEFRVTIWNRGAERLYGYTAEEALGRHAREIASSTGDTSRLALEQELLETGRTRTEITAYRKDGRPVAVELISLVVRDEQGEITGYVGIHRDMTERKRAEEELHAAHERIASILESIGEAFVGIDRDWRYSYLNDRAVQRIEAWLGQVVTRDELLGRNVWELFPAAVGTEVEQRLRDAMDADRPVAFELYFAPTDEWVETLAYPSPAGLSIYYRHITDRKRAEEQRREAQRRVETVLESITDAFFAVDRDWRLTYVNARAADVIADLLGERATPGELVGRTVWEVFPAALGTSAQEAFERALREQQTVVLEYLYPDGRTWFEIHCYPSPDGLSVYFRDVTQRKREEQQLVYHARLLENVQDAVIATDERFAVTAWNKAAEQMFGWSAEEALGRTISDVVRSDYTDTDLEDAFGELREAGSRRVDRLRYARDGTPVHAEAITVALRDDHGATSGYLSILRDVAERHRAEAERARRAREQALIADLGQRALANFDDVQGLMDEAVALVARALDADLVMIGESLPESGMLLARAGVGWSPGVVGHATKPGATGSLAGYALDAGEAVVVEDVATDGRFARSALMREHRVASGVAVVIRRRRGAFGVLEALTTMPRAFSNADVNVLQAIANVLSAAIERAVIEERLSEVKDTERRRLARDLHDRALADLSEALAEASRAQAAQADPEAARRLAQVVRSLRRAGEQLRAAIYDLRLGEEEEQRPFRELLADLVEVHRAREAGYEIRLRLGEDLPTGALGAAGTEVLRILGEALTNAQRHSGARAIRVAAWGSAGTLFATVADDGRGFDPAAAPRPGQGTGLTSMRERADLLDADLQVRTRPGTGTEVRLAVRLPGQAGAPERPVRVLLVEDHAAVREAIAAAFEREPDFEVTGQAASLAEARAMLRDVDVAVVDLALPDGYGGDLIRQLREVNPEAQALVLSASLDRVELARALEAGAAGALDKTVHLDEVTDAVRRLRAGETLLSANEVIELVRTERLRREREADERRAIEQLTDREREVLQALADGLNSQAIADRLHISVRTERNHIANILGKLGVHSQLQALVFALRHGVVELRDPRAARPAAPGS